VSTVPEVLESRHDIEHTMFEVLMKCAGAGVAVAPGNIRRTNRAVAYVALIYSQIRSVIKEEEAVTGKSVEEWSNVGVADVSRTVMEWSVKVTKGVAGRMQAFGEMCNEVFINEPPKGVVGEDILVNIAIVGLPEISDPLAAIRLMAGDYIYIKGGMRFNTKNTAQDTEYLNNLLDRLCDAGDLLLTNVADIKDYGNGKKVRPEMLEVVFEDVRSYVMPRVADAENGYALHSDVIGGGYDPGKFSLKMPEHLRSDVNYSFWDIIPTGGAFSVDEAVVIMGPQSSLLAEMLDKFLVIYMEDEPRKVLKLSAPFDSGEVEFVKIDGEGLGAKCRGISMVSQSPDGAIEVRFDLKSGMHIFENVVNILWFASIYGLPGLKYFDRGGNSGKFQIDDGASGRTIDVELGGERSEFAFIFEKVTDNDMLTISFGISNPASVFKNAAEAGAGVENIRYQWGHTRLAALNVSALAATAGYLYEKCPMNTRVSMSHHNDDRTGQLFLTYSGVPLKLMTIKAADPDSEEQEPMVQEQA